MAADRLGDMFNRQQLFQHILGNDVDLQAFLNEQVLALFVETGEMIQETNWKTWKKPRETNWAKVREEVIDMWHFLINISIHAGIDAKTVHARFVEKNEENLRRQREGY